MAEKRLCLNILDGVTHHCVSMASSKGKLEIDSLREAVVEKLADLSNPPSYKFDIEGGSRQLIMKACKAMTSYANEQRNMESHLRVVAQCAKALGSGIPNLVREMVDLLNNGNSGNDEGQDSADLADLLDDDIRETEERHFMRYLEAVRKTIRECVKIGWICEDVDDFVFHNKERRNAASANQVEFPGYISSSLLSIVHFKAELFKVFGGMVRKSAGETYEMIIIKVASDECLKGICSEIESKMSIIGTAQMKRLSTEIQFIIEILGPYLSTQTKNGCLERVEDLLRRAKYNEEGDEEDYLEQLNELGQIYKLSLALDAASTVL